MCSSHSGNSKDTVNPPKNPKPLRNEVLVCSEIRLFPLSDLICGNNACNTIIFPSKENEVPEGRYRKDGERLFA